MSDSKKHEPPPGFAYYAAIDPDTLLPQQQLLVPSNLKVRLEEDCEARLQRAREERRARVEAKRDEETRRADMAWKATAAPVQRPSRLSGSGSGLPEPGVHYDPAREHVVFDPNEWVAVHSTLMRNHVDKADRQRLDAIDQELSSKGPVRPIGLPDNVNVEMDALARAQPHFAEVVALVRKRLHLMERSGQPMRIPPMLLCGDPGVGKTHFALCLAQSLGTAVRRITMDSQQTNSALTGSDKHWSNSSYGLLFELLAMGSHANPVVVLDEVDKVNCRNGGYDPLAPLHTLLEPSTAKQVRDLSLELQLDASLVTYILTANDHLRVPNTLLSRVRVFHIRQPSGAAAIQVAQAVIESVVAAMLPGAQMPDRKFAVALAHLTAREVYQATEDAVASASTSGRSHLVLSDLPGWATWIDEAAGSILH